MFCGKSGGGGVDTGCMCLPTKHLAKVKKIIREAVGLHDQNCETDYIKQTVPGPVD